MAMTTTLRTLALAGGLLTGWGSGAPAALAAPGGCPGRPPAPSVCMQVYCNQSAAEWLERPLAAGTSCEGTGVCDGHGGCTGGGAPPPPPPPPPPVDGDLPEPVTLRFPRLEFENRIEAAMECYRNPYTPACTPDCPVYDPANPACPDPPACALDWRASGAQAGTRVQVTRKNDTTLTAAIRMQCEINNFHNPDVNIHLDLRLSCFWSQPSVRVTPFNINVDVDWPWWVDLYTLSVTWWTGNITSRAATSQFRASGAVEDFIEEVMVDLAYCPGILVLSDGSVEIDLGMGSECTNGARRHRRCPSGTYGTGYTDVCVGGRWGYEHGSCEPIPPPGGSPP